MVKSRGMIFFCNDWGMIFTMGSWERGSVSALRVFNIAIPHLQAIVKTLRLRRMRFFHRSPGTEPFFQGLRGLRVATILHFPAFIEGRGQYFCLRFCGEPHAFCIQNFFQDHSFRQIIQSQVYNTCKLLKENSDTFGLTVPIFFFSLTAGNILAFYMAIFWNLSRC